ncbi:ZmpA/ZmpB/ZmpC family metallo-endopeptidase [Gemelliphila palaticanis]|uniref:G5 domain-containing protein n=1 Tax=Gemelliphila palaticanis TaxID=81950 RepID=A0ABX2SZ70_9BACL|nr:ZmpA/ZmpB/ZmpC family metallo-endopeptidase [Gemella palaticanis]MBF0715703.1 G5 domain-containing protein [Gemella palaticanis]NYS47633.1 G5 domain-containing protein [Gemella palaticanis]
MNNKKEKYSIRKLTIGCASCLIGLFIGLSTDSYAVEVTDSNSTITYDNGVIKQKNNNIDSAVSELDNFLNEYNSSHQSIIDKYGGGYIPTSDYSKEMIRLIKQGVPPKEATIQAKNKAKAERMDLLDMRVAYNNVYNSKTDIIRGVLQNSKDNVQRNVDIIKNNPVEFMVGLTYLERLYNFNVGNIKAKDLLANHIDYFNASKNNIDFIIDIGKQNANNLTLLNTTTLYNNVIKNYTNIQNIPSFIESVKPANLDVDTWFKETSKAIISEKASTVEPTYKYKLYDKLKDTHVQYILPLLNVSENSIYAISNPTTVTFGMVDTYGVEHVKSNIEDIANKQAQFIDFWLRNADSNVKSKLSGTKLVIDTMAKKETTPNQPVRDRWADRIGENSTLGIKEFLGPMNKWKLFTFVDGYADGESGMSLILTPALYDRGVTTYTHELTHIYDKSVFFDGYTRRDGLEVEFFARGLLEAYTNTKEPIFNLNTTFTDKTDEDFVNKTPERFKTPEDIQEYMKGVLDVTYFLNGLEANDILTRGDEAKLKWFKKHSQVVDTRERKNNGTSTYTHTVDNFSFLNNASNLTTINDLIDNDIVARRYNYKGFALDGTAGSNDYYVIPLFTPLYSAFNNPNGVSGDITSRLMAYELLGEYGYHEGFVPFLSNKLKTGDRITDTDVYNSILSKYNGDVKAFKKAMYEKRLNKEVKPVSIMFNNKEEHIRNKADIVTLLENAITEDLLVASSGEYNNNGTTLSRKLANESNVEKLKAALFLGYKKLTNDFRTSIFKEESEIIYVDATTVNGDGSENSPFNDFRKALEVVKPGGKIVLKESVTVAGTGDIVIDKNITIEGSGNTLNVRGHNIDIKEDVNMSNINLSMLRDGKYIPNIYTGNNNVNFDNVTTLVSEGQAAERPNLVIGNKDVSSAEKVANVTFTNSKSNTIFNSIELGGANPNNHTLNIDSNVDSYSGINVDNAESDYTINIASNKITTVNGNNLEKGNVNITASSLKDYSVESIKNVNLPKDIKANKIVNIKNLTLNGAVTSTTPVIVDSINGTGTLKLDLVRDVLTVNNVANTVNIELKPENGLIDDEIDTRVINTENVVNNVTIDRDGYSLRKTDAGYLLSRDKFNVDIEFYLDIDKNNAIDDEDEFRELLNLQYVDDNLSSYINKLNEHLNKQGKQVKESSVFDKETNDAGVVVKFKVIIEDKSPNSTEVIGETVVETTEDIESNIIEYVADPESSYGSERVITNAQNGLATIRTTYKTINGERTEEKIGEPVREVTKQPINKVIAKGTKSLEEKETIAYETEYRADNEKTYGDDTETGGVDGERTYITTYTLDTTSGNITTSKNAGKVTKQPENKIITKGTKPLIEEFDIDPEIKYVYLSDKPSTFKEELPGKKGLKRKTTNYILDTTTGNIEVVVGSFKIIKESTPTIIKLGINNDTSIDYSVKYEADYSREYGTPNIVIQEGKKGVINSNGEVVTKPENKIISVGAKSNSTITPIEFETIRKEVTYLKLGEVAEVTEGKDGYEKVTNSYVVDINTGEVTVSTNREIKNAIARVIEVGIGESKVPDYNLENEDKPEFNLEIKVPDYNLENEDKPEFNLETKVPDYNLENEDKPEFNLETKVPDYNLENEDKPEFNLETKVPDYNLENEDKPEFNLETKVPDYNLENEDKHTISAEEVSKTTSKKDKLPSTGLNSVAGIYGLVPLFGAYLLNRRKNQ